MKTEDSLPAAAKAQLAEFLSEYLRENLSISIDTSNKRITVSLLLEGKKISEADAYLS
jgi:hypothetical protein